VIKETVIYGKIIKFLLKKLLIVFVWRPGHPVEFREPHEIPLPRWERVRAMVNTTPSNSLPPREALPVVMGLPSKTQYDLTKLVTSVLNNRILARGEPGRSAGGAEHHFPNKAHSRK
jgi:hypothetical protein